MEVGGDSAPALVPAPAPAPSGRATLNSVSSQSADAIVVMPGDDQSPPGNSLLLIKYRVDQQCCPDGNCPETTRRPPGDHPR